MRNRIVAALVAAFIASGSTALAKDDGASPVLKAMRDELGRSMKAFKSQPLPPYFLSYEINETHEVRVTGSFGTITESHEGRSRQLDIDLRVGSNDRDNTHQLRGSFEPFWQRFDRVLIPLSDDPDAIRAILWYHTDAEYKRATEHLTRVKADVQVKVEEEDRSADFSREAPESYRETASPLTADLAAWQERIRKYTAPFASHPEIYEARAYVSAKTDTRWLVSSEGTEIQTSRPAYYLFIYALTKADDGMELPRYETWFSSTPEGLPSDERVLEAVERMIADLGALRQAPIVDPYTGPAILSGRAAGVFFHEVFGHRIEGHRQKDESEGQTFKKKIGEQILPATFSVYGDPTIQRYTVGVGRGLAPREVELAGAYRYDNEGVKARRVAVVKDGVLKSFLMSRSPVEGFPSSNGHGRRQPGMAPVARQSNLLVEVSDPVSAADLKQKLIDQMKREGKPFGLRFVDIQGGFTMTGRTVPNAFNVLPIMVYRVFPDGREELVRGVDLIGTPLLAISKIAAADDEVGVFNGMCGAESGMVPVAAASPGLLVTQIEVQKKEKSQERPPVLPAPSKEGK